MTPTRSEHPGRILLIRPSALGDVCRTVPVLASLRRAYPNARIDWLVQDSFLDAIAAHPALSSPIPFPRARLGRWWHPGTLPAIMAFLRSLRSARYDLVIDCQGLARSGFIAAATGAPRRVGYSDAAEFGWLGLSGSGRVDAPRTMHTVDRMLALAAAAGAEPLRDMRLYTSPPHREAADTLLALPPAAGLAVIAPTARWPAKRWPQDRFAEVAARLLSGELPGITAVAAVGAASEREQCGQLFKRLNGVPGFIDLVGKTPVGVLMAVIERSSLVVANDSAALHIAVGFDRPCVALFGPTRVDLVGPYGRTECVLQHVTADDTLDHKKPAVGEPLMRRISVAEVIERLHAMTRGPAATPALRHPSPAIAP